MVAAIYARQSLDQAKLGAAVERQIDECRAYAKAQGIVVLEEYVDNDVSATTGIRPAFTRLVAAIEAGTIDTVICWHTDRLYRRVRDLVDLVDLAESRKLSIMSVRSGTLDLTTPSGRLVAGMLGHAARFEVEHKSARQAVGIAQMARKGIMRSNRTLYGYRRTGRLVTIDEFEAKVVRQLYSRYIAGWSRHKLAKDLNERGIKSPRDAQWKGQTVGNMLSNKTYCGLSVYRGEVVGVGQWTPLISRRQFSRYEAVRDARPAQRVMENPSPQWLSGIVTCDECGELMGARTDNHPKRDAIEHPLVYRCLRGDGVTRLVVDVDREVERAILERLSSIDQSPLVHSQLLVGPELAKIEELRERKRELATALAEGLFPLTAVRARALGLSRQIRELQLFISDQLGGNLVLELLDHDDIEHRWRQLSTHDRRRIALSLITVRILRRGISGPDSRPDLIKISWRDSARYVL
jgi:DNA invertase Pin-like site-specific DNA recombinase